MVVFGLLALVLGGAPPLFAAPAKKTPATKKKRDEESAKPVRVKAARLETGTAFDSDDNLIILSDSQVYIFDKAGKEKAISTADWAIVKNQLGKPGPYKNYSLNDDPEKGSFREFGNFVADLEKAIARGKLPGHSPTEWQGPSWPAFKAALENADSAKLAAIISARGISPAEYYKGLKLLKDAGYIAHLPLLKHVYTVGYKKFDDLGKTIPEKKLGAMKLLLDDLEAAGVPEGAPPVTDRAGTGTAALNLWGFSDDDYDNYQTALKGLSAEIKKGRWPHVKVSLLFTGLNNPDHKPVNVVLQNDGTSREMLPGELDQWLQPARGKGKTQVVVVGTDVGGKPGAGKPGSGKQGSGGRPDDVGGATSGTKGTTTGGTRPTEPSSGGKAPSEHSSGGARPMQRPDVVKSSDASVEANIDQMNTSYPFPTTNPKVKAGVDLIQVEVKAMNDYIADTKIPNAKKRIILTRYEVGDAAVVDALIAAKKKGIPVTFINDFNTSLDYKFADGEHSTVDFAKAAFKEGPNGVQLKRLYDAGFKLNGSDWAIYSQPLYRGDSMAPIMHEKSLILMNGDTPALYVQGTNNMTDNIRVNRSFVSHNLQLATYAFQHATALAATFAKGGAIKDVPSPPPLRVLTADGSYIEMAYTDGKYNPNDRIADVLSTGKVKRVLGSNFVMTNSKVIDGMKGAIERNPDMSVDLVVDQQFIDPRGFGMAGVTDDFDVVRPMGGPIPAWPAADRKNVNLIVWQKDTPGRKETTLGGPPVDRVLWHDKTTVVYKEEDGKLWAYVFTGSLNNSNHAANAELQQMWRLPADSPYVKAIEDSVLLVAKANPDSAVPGTIGIERIAIGRLVGHRETEVPVDKTRALLDALAKGDYKAVAVQLEEIAKLQTSLEKHPTPAQIKANIDKLTKVLEWMAGQPQFKGKPVTPPEFFSLADLVARPETSPKAASYILNSVLARTESGQPDAKAPEASLKAAAELIGVRVAWTGDGDFNGGHGISPERGHASVPVPKVKAQQAQGQHEEPVARGTAATSARRGVRPSRGCIKGIAQAAGVQ